MDTQTDEPSTSTGYVIVDDLVKQIEEFAEDITARVRKNTLVAQGMQTFLKRYKNMAESGPFHNAC